MPNFSNAEKKSCFFLPPSSTQFPHCPEQSITPSSGIFSTFSDSKLHSHSLSRHKQNRSLVCEVHTEKPSQFSDRTLFSETFKTLIAIGPFEFSKGRLRRVWLCAFAIFNFVVVVQLRYWLTGCATTTTVSPGHRCPVRRESGPGHQPLFLLFTLLS